MKRFCLVVLLLLTACAGEIRPGETNAEYQARLEQAHERRRRAALAVALGLQNMGQSLQQRPVYYTCPGYETLYVAHNVTVGGYFYTDYYFCR